MHNRRKSTRARTPLRWLLPLWGLGAGCFIDLPERLTDGGVEGHEADILFGMAPGTTPDSPGTKPPRTADPDLGASGVGPAPPPATQAPSGGPEPPTMAPTGAPSDPPLPCEPGVCHACDGDRLVPSENDARCDPVDCLPFPLVMLEQDAETGTDVCNGYASRLASLCDPSGVCRVASAETCTSTDGVPIEFVRASSCQHVENCMPGVIARLVSIPVGQPCIGVAGVCDGLGNCIEIPSGGNAAEVCEHLPLRSTIAGAPQTFCEAQNLDANVCRFALQLGSIEADPNPADLNPEVNCGHFCARYGWTCVAARENERWNQCEPRGGNVDDAIVENGCDRTIVFDRNDDVDVFNGILCECRLQ